jgi:hypothetical protein
MNFVAISPNFPPNYHQFWKSLARRGVTILGLGDTAYDELDPEMRACLTEYYYLQHMLDYQEQLKAVAYLTFRHGKIDRLESHNEFWLESDAALRSDFNIFGLKRENMPQIKHKSEMKKVFEACGVPTARGCVVNTLADAEGLINEVGYPVVAKPDVGVGANQTYTIENRDELEYFFKHKPSQDYIFEEFIHGKVVTYDGLVDRHGNVVFDSAMTYSLGVMETVNKSEDIWYYVDREVPERLREAGRKILKMDKILERFFHIEFFELPNGEYYGLEVNMRPPGGLTTDMWNYSNDFDIYEEYANLVTEDTFKAEVNHKYYCGYASRRYAKNYHYAIEDIFSEFGQNIMLHTSIEGVFAPALGDYGFIFRTEDYAKLEKIASWIMKLKETSVL